MPSKNVKIVFTSPETHSELLRQVIADAGAGQIGNYSHCSITSKVEGRSLPNEFANPTIGTPGKLEVIIEDKIEVICSREKLPNVLKALKENHPYEEMALDIYALEDPIYE
jgi:hypothetical protein